MSNKSKWLILLSSIIFFMFSCQIIEAKDIGVETKSGVTFTLKKDSTGDTIEDKKKPIKDSNLPKTGENINIKLFILGIVLILILMGIILFEKLIVDCKYLILKKKNNKL
ncbi:LPXTG cell wall anchor domain-containing protein [Vagococcus fluvialis]|uniref:LPXTG cell wall anchor domain-containing protein n=1 Tax=Vagococcus fluvialis TaxID=2738 RepID=A0A7X6DA08_9ENTE|nr:LPXTG cell wall anchor domain-containing protein [Vagococcus fluvialis]NKC68535.1 LPXTG cell wall anchor domain-containing protein [Vagococcus fluvialis]